LTSGYRRSTTASGNNPTGGTWTLPAGWQPGDLVVVWLYARAGAYAIANPAGITIKHNSNNGNNGRLFIGYRYLQAGDTSFAWTRTTSSSNTDVLWGVVVLRGTVSAGDPFNASTGATPTTGTGADPDPAAVTPTIAGSTVWAIGGKRDDAGGTFNPPANYTLAGAIQSTAGSDASAATIVRHNRPVASENPGAIDLGTVSAAWAAWTGAISPMPASTTTYTYDYADRLRTATIGATTETYTYAGDGVRLSASTGGLPGQTTKFGWDRVFGLPQLVIERDGADALLRSYRYGWDLVSQTAGANIYHYQHDGLGSVSDVTGVSANSLTWSEYYPYGVVRLGGAGAGAPAVNPFAFTGEQRDGTTGLYHLRARQYDPGTGRFLTTDPLAPLLTDPYVASYVYVRDRPCGMVDPSGLAGERSGSRPPPRFVWEPEYCDFNVTLGILGVVVTTGYLWDNSGGHRYIGGGIGTPGFSLTCSNDSITTGLNSGVQGGYGLVGQFGQAVPHGERFTEIGLGLPGASATYFWVFEKGE
jgi:RHS repeat-associated protein